MEIGKRRRESEKVTLLLTFGMLSFTVTGFQHTVSNIKVENAYVRVAAQGMSSAGYFKVSNSSNVADTLYQVKTDFAMMAQLHESFRKNGMAGMKEVKFIVVPAKSSITLKPGGYHVMLMNVEYDLKSGTQVRFWLMFKHAGEIEVNAPVK